MAQTDMLFAITFPDIDPEAFSLSLGGFHFAVRWYALAYITGILVGWRLIVMAVKRPELWPNQTAPMKPEQVEDFLTWVVIGVIAGGRLGFVFFYQPAHYLANPVEILFIWQGGMAFHGGLIGVAAAAYLFCRKNNIPLPQVGDALALAVPPGLLLGRIANFVNAELWGRPTDVAWGVIFPGGFAQACPGIVGLCARHPSQLYEALLEGLVLGAIVLWLAFKAGWLKHPGRVTGVFIAGYGVSRFIVEYFRQADAQYISPDNPWGHVVRIGEAGITMGQLLSLPMVLAGTLLIVFLMRLRT